MKSRYTISIHRCVFISVQDGVDEVFFLTHPGLYRKRLVSTTHMDGGIVQCTHHSKVQFAEMPREDGHLSIRGGSLDSLCIFTYPPFHRECL